MADAVAWDKSQYRRQVDDLEARRVMVYGVTGSGKTTAAARISAATGIPWTSVDDLTWEPGWVPVPEDEQRRRIGEICARDSWLLDTAYGQWLEVPMAGVDLVVALDYPRWFSLQRLVRRTLARVLDKKTICNGNTETWRQLLGSDSIIRWHFRSFDRKRSRIRAWEADTGGPRVLRFTRPRDLETWIAGLEPVGPLAEEQAG
jgi:adenylate kinase family enzyme